MIRRMRRSSSKPNPPLPVARTSMPLPGGRGEEVHAGSEVLPARRRSSYALYLSAEGGRTTRRDPLRRDEPKHGQRVTENAEVKHGKNPDWELPIDQPVDPARDQRRVIRCNTRKRCLPQS